MKKLYEFPLPIGKQGDDFAQHIEDSEFPREALFLLADQYEYAADLCRRVARKATDDLTVECAQAHEIIISDEESYMESLEEDDILFEVVVEVCEDCKDQMN